MDRVGGVEERGTGRIGGVRVRRSKDNVEKEEEVELVVLIEEVEVE